MQTEPLQHPVNFQCTKLKISLENGQTFFDLCWNCDNVPKSKPLKWIHDVKVNGIYNNGKCESIWLYN